jgi:trigger factor
MSDLLHSFEIELPEHEIQEAIYRKTGANSGQPPAGFRRHRLPLKYILQRFGEKLLSDVLQEMLQKRMDAHVATEKLDVAGAVQITGLWSILDRPLRYRYQVTFESYPKFEVQGLDVLQLRVPKPTLVNDSHVDAALEILRRQNSTWQRVEHGAEKGDRVTVDFDSFLEDGHAFPGGKADNVNVELGAGGMLPEFENALIGAKAGRALDFPVTFPVDYTTPALAGKTACFSVMVLEVCHFDLIPLDDAFAAKIGHAGLLELREAARVHLQQQHDEQDQRDIRSDLLRQLSMANSIPLPYCLVVQQLQSLQAETAAQRGLSLEQVQVDDSLIEVAQNRVHLSVVVRRLIVQEKLQIDPNRDLSEQVAEWLKNRAARNVATIPS